MLKSFKNKKLSLIGYLNKLCKCGDTAILAYRILYFHMALRKKFTDENGNEYIDRLRADWIAECGFSSRSKFTKSIKKLGSRLFYLLI